MKYAVSTTILVTLLAGCNRGFATKTVDERQGVPAAATDQDVPFRDATNGYPDAEVAIALEPATHLEEVEPAGRAASEDADANHDKWAAAAKEKGLNLSAGPSARDASVPYAALDTDVEVPNWTRKDLARGFAYLRDIMLTKADNAGRARRLTWLYPDDGCYARAALGGFLLKYNGFKRPFNVFSFGNLSAKTANHPQGYVHWAYHVAPLVEVDGVVWVLDPAMEATRPVTLADWLGRQTASVGSVKVAICDAGSMNPNAACRGGADPAKFALGYLRGTFFDREEKRQVELGRDPAQVLGAAPPWRITPACGVLATATLAIAVGPSHAADAVCVNGDPVSGSGASRAFTSNPLCADRDSSFKVGYCADASSAVATTLRAGAAGKVALP